MNKENFLEQYNGELLSSKEIQEIMGSRMAVSRLRDEGIINLVTGKIYSVGDSYNYENEALIILSKYYPQAVISGASALFYQEMGEFLSDQLEIDISRNSSILSESEYFLVNFVSDSKITGIEEKEIQGYKVKIYNKTRCLIDLLRNGKSSSGEFFQKAVNIYYKNGLDRDELKKLKESFPKEVSEIYKFISFLDQQKSIY